MYNKAEISDPDFYDISEFTESNITYYSINNSTSNTN